MTRSINIAALTVLAALPFFGGVGCDSCAKAKPVAKAAPAVGRPDPVEAAKAEYATRWHQGGRVIQGRYIPLVVQEKDDAARKVITDRMQAEYGQLETTLRVELAKKFGAGAVNAAIDLFKKEKGVAAPSNPGACDK